MEAKSVAPPVKIRAIDRNHDCRALQIFQLRMLYLAIDLREALLAGHGENGVAECHQDSEQAQDRDVPRSLKKSQRIVTELEIR